MIINMEINNELSNRKPNEAEAAPNTMARIKDQQRIYDVCHSQVYLPPTQMPPKQEPQPPLDPYRQKELLICQFTFRHLFFYFIFFGIMMAMGENYSLANCDNQFEYKNNQQRCDAFLAVLIYSTVFFPCHFIIRTVIYCMEPELGQLPFHRRFCYQEKYLNYLLFILSEIIELALGPLTIVLMLVGFGVFLWRRRRWTSMKVINEYKELELSRRFCYC